MTADAPRDDDHELETASLCPKSTWDSCEPQRARAEMNLDDPASQRECVAKSYQAATCLSRVSD